MRISFGQCLSVLTELSLFYRDLCSPKLFVAHILELVKDITYLVCKLEKIFPLFFFLNFLCNGASYCASVL